MAYVKNKVKHKFNEMEKITKYLLANSNDVNDLDFESLVKRLESLETKFQNTADMVVKMSELYNEINALRKMEKAIEDKTYGIPDLQDDPYYNDSYIMKYIFPRRGMKLIKDKTLGETEKFTYSILLYKAYRNGQITEMTLVNNDNVSIQADNIVINGKTISTLYTIPTHKEIILKKLVWYQPELKIRNDFGILADGKIIIHSLNEKYEIIKEEYPIEGQVKIKSGSSIMVSKTSDIDIKWREIQTYQFTDINLNSTVNNWIDSLGDNGIGTGVTILQTLDTVYRLSKTVPQAVSVTIQNENIADEKPLYVDTDYSANTLLPEEKDNIKSMFDTFSTDDETTFGDRCFANVHCMHSWLGGFFSTSNWIRVPEGPEQDSFQGTRLFIGCKNDKVSDTMTSLTTTPLEKDITLVTDKESIPAKLRVKYMLRPSITKVSQSNFVNKDKLETAFITGSFAFNNDQSSEQSGSLCFGTYTDFKHSQRTGKQAIYGFEVEYDSVVAYKVEIEIPKMQTSASGVSSINVTIELNGLSETRDISLRPVAIEHGNETVSGLESDWITLSPSTKFPYLIGMTIDDDIKDNNVDVQSISVLEQPLDQNYKYNNLWGQVQYLDNPISIKDRKSIYGTMVRYGVNTNHGVTLFDYTQRIGGTRAFGPYAYLDTKWHGVPIYCKIGDKSQFEERLDDDEIITLYRKRTTLDRRINQTSDSPRGVTIIRLPSDIIITSIDNVKVNFTINTGNINFILLPEGIFSNSDIWEGVITYRQYIIQIIQENQVIKKILQNQQVQIDELNKAVNEIADAINNLVQDLQVQQDSILNMITSVLGIFGQIVMFVFPVVGTAIMVTSQLIGGVNNLLLGNYEQGLEEISMAIFFAIFSGKPKDKLMEYLEKKAGSLKAKLDGYGKVGSKFTELFSGRFGIRARRGTKSETYRILETGGTIEDVDITKNPPIVRARVNSRELSHGVDIATGERKLQYKSGWIGFEDSEVALWEQENRAMSQFQLNEGYLTEQELRDNVELGLIFYMDSQMGMGFEPLSMLENTENFDDVLRSVLENAGLMSEMLVDTSKPIRVIR